MWLIMFYAFFHCALNLFAEITRFGDRQFYKDWWNCSFIDEYWRTWNLVRDITHLLNIILNSLLISG